jgi:hypothetical protein
MVSAIEQGIFLNEVTELKKPTYFIPAEELSVTGLAWVAKITGGSLQHDPYYPEETSVYYARDGVGIIISDSGRFSILQARKKEHTFYQDRRENGDLEESFDNATIALDQNGSIHIAWPIQTTEIVYGFAGITINQQIDNVKQIVFHPIQDITLAQDSLILETAKKSYERSFSLAA